jgi:hypothetical protein
LSVSVTSNVPPLSSIEPTDWIVLTLSSPWSWRTASWSLVTQTSSLAFGTRFWSQFSGVAQFALSPLPLQVIVQATASAAAGAPVAETPATTDRQARTARTAVFF